uniref:Ovule protein n=1 Tax=Heterorhabditis bacteriophora TaxID=37862 RepID=A0A1I7W9S1_HETBA
MSSGCYLCCDRIHMYSYITTWFLHCCPRGSVFLPLRKTNRFVSLLAVLKTINSKQHIHLVQIHHSIKPSYLQRLNRVRFYFVTYSFKVYCKKGKKHSNLIAEYNLPDLRKVIIHLNFRFFVHPIYSGVPSSTHLIQIVIVDCSFIYNFGRNFANI